MFEACELKICSPVLNHLYYFAHFVSFLYFAFFLNVKKKAGIVFFFFFLTSAECPELKKPSNGSISCRKVSGKLLCIMSCNEGYSFNAEAVTVYGCGPDTNWKWNDMDEPVLPTCSSM